MILFFYGPNSYASRRKLQEMVGTYVRKTGSDMGLARIDGLSVNAKELAAQASAVPFLATSRLVIVEYLSANKKAADQVGEIISGVPNSTVMVFYEKEVDKRTSFFKALQSHAKTQVFEMLSPAQLTAWAGRQIAALGGTVERGALAALIDRVGDDQWRLEQEIQKLVHYSPQVTPETVDLLVEPTRDENIFELIESATNGRVGRALARYDDIIAAGGNEMYVLTMITWQLRNLVLAKAAGGMSSQNLAKAAGLSPFVAQKSMDRQVSFSFDQLKEGYLAAVETEYAIKTGAGKPKDLVELLIYKLGEIVTSR